MNKRREKAKPQKPLLNKQLIQTDGSASDVRIAKNKSMRVFMLEFGKFLVDISKLVFGGVILAGIMDEEINHQLLFTVGSCIVASFAFIGLYIISINKEE